jgi:hypothetical protein
MAWIAEDVGNFAVDKRVAAPGHLKFPQQTVIFQTT